MRRRRHHRDEGHYLNTRRGAALMTTSNIGPCNCCGEVCTCSGTTTWTFNGTTNYWVSSPCSNYAANPCCEAKIGDTIDIFYNPLYWSPPWVEGMSFVSTCRNEFGHDRCNCTVCILTWDDFLQSWSVTTGCTHPTANTLHSACECPTPENNGTTHGETVSLSCGCP